MDKKFSRTGSHPGRDRSASKDIYKNSNCKNNRRMSKYRNFPLVTLLEAILAPIFLAALLTACLLLFLIISPGCLVRMLLPRRKRRKVPAHHNGIYIATTFPAR